MLLRVACCLWLSKPTHNMPFLAYFVTQLTSDTDNCHTWQKMGIDLSLRRY